MSIHAQFDVCSTLVPVKIPSPTTFRIVFSVFYHWPMADAVSPDACATFGKCFGHAPCGEQRVDYELYDVLCGAIRWFPDATFIAAPSVRTVDCSGSAKNPHSSLLTVVRSPPLLVAHIVLRVLRNNSSRKTRTWNLPKTNDAFIVQRYSTLKVRRIVLFKQVHIWREWCWIENIKVPKQ